MYNLVDDALFYCDVADFSEISSFFGTPIPTGGQPVDNFLFPLMNTCYLGMTLSLNVDECPNICSYPHLRAIDPQAIPTPLG